VEPQVIVVLHIALELLPECRDGRERLAVNQLGLQGMKERLHMGVLVGRSSTRHALLDAGGGQTRPEWRAEKLATAIAVKD